MTTIINRMVSELARESKFQKLKKWFGELDRFTKVYLVASILIVLAVSSAIAQRTNLFSQAAVDVRPISLVMYGSHSTTVDNRIIAAKPMFLISNTPHNPWGGNCQASKFNNAGIKVFSYITAGYENGYPEAIPNDLNSNLNYVNAIAANDTGVYGIFMDEVDAYPDNSYYAAKGSDFKWNYIQQISERVHSKGLKLMCNTGMNDWDDRLMNYCDIMMSSEQYSGSSLSSSQAKWADRVVVLSQNVSNASTAIQYTNKAISQGLLAAYMGPYMGLPSWWETYVAGVPFVSSVAYGAPIPYTVSDYSSPADSQTNNDNGTTSGSANASDANTGYWQPTADRPIHFQWQIGTSFNPATDFLPGVTVYDVDGFDTSAATVQAIHDKGYIAICYVDVGGWESGRPDASNFPSSVRGAKMADWPEYYLDIRSPIVRQGMADRIEQQCKNKGFDAVEPDVIDAYANNSGFPLTAADQISYNRFLAETIHSMGMSAGLKGDTGQARQLEPYFDWTLNEECAQYNECGELDNFIAANKAVFQVEYSGGSTFCADANANHRNAQRRDLGLSRSGTRVVCIPDSQNTWIPGEEPEPRATTTPVPQTRPTNTPTPTRRPTSTPTPTTRPSSTPIPTRIPSSTPTPTTRPTNTPIPTETPSSAPNTPTPTRTTTANTVTGTVDSTPSPTGGTNEYEFYLKITESNVSRISVGQRVWLAATTTDYPNLRTVGTTLTGTLDDSEGWWVLEKTDSRDITRATPTPTPEPRSSGYGRYFRDFYDGASRYFSNFFRSFFR